MAEANYNISNPFFDLNADYTVNGKWTFTIPPIEPGFITGGLNVGGGAEVFKDVVGSDLRFRTLVAGTGMALTPGADVITLDVTTTPFDPANSYTFTGDEQFNGGFGVNAPTTVGIVSADALNLGSTNDLNVASFAGSTTVAANVDLNLNATTGDASINCLAGTLSLNGQTGGNLSFTAGAIQIGSSVGSGMSIDLITGNFSFGASVGSFELGAITNSVTVLAGTTMTLSSPSILIPTLPNSVVANSVFYDSGSGQISYGLASSSFDPSLSYTFTGTDQFNGGFGVNSPSTINITSDMDLQLFATGNVALEADTLNADAVGDVEYSSNAGHIYFTTNNGDIQLNCNGAGHEIFCYSSDGNAFFGADAGLILSSATLNLEVVGGDTMSIHTTNLMSIFTGTGSISVVSATDLNMDAAGLINIAPNTATGLNFGNANTASTLVGTQFQAALTTALVLDAPSVEIANSAATNVTFGNGAATIVVNCSEIDVTAAVLVDIDSAASLQLGQSDATTIQIGNAGTSTLVITGQLPGSAPVGSVPVLWDPVGKQFYHS